MISDRQTIILKELLQAARVLDDFLKKKENILQIEKSAKLLAHAFFQGNKAISCGNGGSHCDAIHFSEELSGKFRENRPPLPAIAISDPAYLSCVSNDFGYEYVFSRYIEALGNHGDILLAISTSGNSLNIVNAILTAKKKKMKIITLTGRDGGAIISKSDICINVPYFGYADRIQEMHIKIIHILILLIEEQFISLHKI